VEFKKMEETYETSYPTQKENKSGLWEWILINKKSTVGLFCLYLLMNQSFGIEFSDTSNVIAGGLQVNPNYIEPESMIISVLRFGIQIICYVTIIVLIIKVIKYCGKKFMEKRQKKDKNE